MNNAQIYFDIAKSMPGTHVNEKIYAAMDYMYKKGLDESQSPEVTEIKWPTDEEECDAVMKCAASMEMETGFWKGIFWLKEYIQKQNK
jgi:recombinational DNA repair protein RecT